MGNVYEVRVHGVVSARLLESLCDDLVMRADTVVYGEVRDQAALHGLLARVRDSGLELVDVRQVSRSSTSTHSPTDDGGGSRRPRTT
jgi:hypothetical protein